MSLRAEHPLEAAISATKAVTRVNIAERGATFQHALSHVFSKAEDMYMTLQSLKPKDKIVI
jgi:hypothetical protein